MITNPFDILVDDIFRNRDITEEMIFNGRAVRVGVSAIDFGPMVTDFGAEQGVSFYLTVRATDAVGIKRGSLVQYRGETYKVDHTEVDAAGLSVKVYLAGLTKFK